MNEACGFTQVCPQDPTFTMGSADSIPVWGFTCDVIANTYKQYGNHWRDPNNGQMVAMFCPPGYNQPDDHWSPSDFVCDRGVMKNACVGTNPTNTSTPVQYPSESDPSDTVGCCLGTNLDAAKNCGIGYCSDGNGCASAMSYYASKYGWDDGIVKKYLQATTDDTIKKQIVESLVQRYYKAIPDVRGNPGNKAALEFCSMVPGACDATLTKVCKTIQNMKDLTSDPDVLNLCGCHMQTHMYDDAYAGIVEKQCSPPCVLPSVLKDQSDGQCEQSVCVLDDINLNILNSSVSGDISISQVCPQSSSTTGGKTQCYMSDVNIDIINSLIGKGVDISQTCSTCNLLNEQDGTSISVPDCKSFSTAKKTGIPVKINLQLLQNKSLSSSSTNILGVILLVIAIIVVIGLVIWLFKRRKY